MTTGKQQHDHRSDIKNPNRGTAGTNITWDKAQGNRGKQMNPNQPQPVTPTGHPSSGQRSHKKS